ncbi:hypothetical protein TSAR_010203 [Trichomalopsis sarcophagae]|uniref:Pacifastin domain-containing protein n=1 Tax=Trichomalopsis sarcophagae TaxID=543379 RepID=A0A232EZT5_9HYME|nr:hypothetical protein TSAR_010203 [Trichomalopsis sarcophagae]
MKSLFVVLVATAVASAHQVCTPGTYFKTECNTCVCANDGSASICTQKQCPPGLFNWDGSLKVPLDIIQQIIPDVSEIEIFESQLVAVGEVTYVQTCTPNSVFHINCNRCQCSKHVKKVCEPNQVFQNNCNTCACNKDSTAAACTLKKSPLLSCPKQKRMWLRCKFNVSSLFDQASADYIVDIVNRTYTSRNERFWNMYFTSTFFLLMLAIFNADDIEMQCKPKTRFKFYCNTCWCSEEGTTRICTKKYCPDNIFNKDGSLKTPPNVHQKLKIFPKGVGSPD